MVARSVRIPVKRLLCGRSDDGDARGVTVGLRGPVGEVASLEVRVTGADVDVSMTASVGSGMPASRRVALASMIKELAAAFGNGLNRRPMCSAMCSNGR